MSLNALLSLDDPALTASLSACLRDRGWECATDDSLVGTLALFKRLSPELVVLDARADLVLRALKADAASTRASVVMISSADAPHLRNRCLRLGALAFADRVSARGTVENLIAFIEHGRSGAVEVTPASPPARPAPAARV
jgi:DNA-binding response OmpR family regulator